MLKRCIMFLSVVVILVCYSQAYDRHKELKDELDYITEKISVLANLQIETHELADAKRGYGFGEDHIIIKNLQENWLILENEKIYLMEYANQIIEELNQCAIITYEPFEVTNISANDFDLMLADSGLEGYGYAFKKMEEEHEVNGVFAIGVAMLESGWGKVAPHNNYFGIKNSRFKSPESCIMYFGKLIKENYANMTFSEIAAKYCPATPKWEYTVRDIMEKVYSRLEE